MHSFNDAFITIIYGSFLFDHFAMITDLKMIQRTFITEATINPANWKKGRY